MMEGIARRKVSTAESTAAIHLKGVRFLARNTAKTMPPTRLYTVERMATAMDSNREVKVTSIWLKSTLHSLPMASGMQKDPLPHLGPVQIHKEQGSHAQNGEQGQEPLQSPVTGGVFYPDAAPPVPQEQAFFSAGSSTAEPATG